MRKRILILDDDKDTLDVLQEVLVYEGFETVGVETTEDLISLVRLHQPILILLDFALKGKNGGAWCEQLKNDAEFRPIPVIILTAYSNKGIAKGIFGCDDFIAKPFELEDLITRVKALTTKTLAQSRIEPRIQQALNYKPL